MSVAAALDAVDVPFNEPLETLLVHSTAVNVLTLVGFTALLYDHFVTLGDEIHLIWRARKGVVSTIFLLNRYCIPIMLALDIFETFGNVAHLLTFCKVWTVVQSYLTIFSFISIHAIVAWRIYAIYNGQAWIARLLWAAGVLNFAISSAVATVSLIPVISDLRPYHHACVGSAPDYIWAIWLPSVVFETLLFGLTINAMYQHGKRNSLTALSLLLYRDGMVYFIAVTFCSLFSLMVWALAGPDLLGLARYFALAMVNIAGSRLVLNLKAYSAVRYGGDSDLAWDIVAAPGSASASAPAPACASGALEACSPAGDVLVFTPLPPRRARWDEEEGDRDRNRDREGWECAFDLEMYAIERECQQLGSRLR